jgi:hypothetical protein
MNLTLERLMCVGCPLTHCEQSGLVLHHSTQQLLLLLSGEEDKVKVLANPSVFLVIFHPPIQL